MICKRNIFSRNNNNRFHLFILVTNTKKHIIKALSLHIFKVYAFIIILAILIILMILTILAIPTILAILIYAYAFS